MSFLADLFRRTFETPQPPRDSEGRFISAHRIDVRAKAIELALANGRPDLAAKLSPHGRTTETPAMTSPEGHCPGSALPGFDV